MYLLHSACTTAVLFQTGVHIHVRFISQFSHCANFSPLWYCASVLCTTHTLCTTRTLDFTCVLYLSIFPLCYCAVHVYMYTLEFTCVLYLSIVCYCAQLLNYCSTVHYTFTCVLYLSIRQFANFSLCHRGLLQRSKLTRSGLD